MFLHYYYFIAFLQKYIKSSQLTSELCAAMHHKHPSGEMISA